MANLIKRGARAPRVTGGYVYTGCDYAEGESGVTPSILYRVTVGNRNEGGTVKHKDEEHRLELTETEMLETVAELMKMYSRNRAEEKKRDAVKLAISRGEHEQRDSPLRSRS